MDRIYTVPDEKSQILKSDFGNVYGRPAGYPFLYLMSYIISCFFKTECLGDLPGHEIHADSHSVYQ